MDIQVVAKFSGISDKFYIRYTLLEEKLYHQRAWVYLTVLLHCAVLSTERLYQSILSLITYYLFIIISLAPYCLPEIFIGLIGKLFSFFLSKVNSPTPTLFLWTPFLPAFFHLHFYHFCLIFPLVFRHFQVITDLKNFSLNILLYFSPIYSQSSQNILYFSHFLTFYSLPHSSLVLIPDLLWNSPY